jgi:hypothetical protein
MHKRMLAAGVLVVAIAALAVGWTLVPGGQRGVADGAFSEAPATNVPQIPVPASATSVAAAQAALMDQIGLDRHFAEETGLNAAAISGSAAAYTFDRSDSTSLAGWTAVRVPLAGGGWCLELAGATSCTNSGPTASNPLVGVGVDIDGDRSGLPFAVVMVKAPDVEAVNFSCNGASYPARIVGEYVAFVSPSSAVSSADCTPKATLNDGEVVSEQ